MEKNFIKETGDRIVGGKFVKRDDGSSTDNRIAKKVPRLEDYLLSKLSKDGEQPTSNEKDVE